MDALLPDELIVLCLHALYAICAPPAQQHMLCYPTSAQQLRRARSARRCATRAIQIGCVSLRFRRLASANAAAGVSCSRLVWFSVSFSVMRSVAEQPLMHDVVGALGDADFQWTGGRHRLRRVMADNTSNEDLLLWRRRGNVDHMALQAQEDGVLIELEYFLMQGAVHGRFAAWRSDAFDTHARIVDEGKAKIRIALRRIMIHGLPSTAPSAWGEVQLFCALWLCCFQCILDVLRESPLNASQLLAEHWDHVHNGVRGRFYWSSPMRLSPVVDVGHHVRFARIWRRAMKLSEDRPSHSASDPRVFRIHL
mmetsp:Transcript_49498/g.114383  ORF Transcript_49498/g.114383 Transcript_49498/m.114383 type:complete len:309 (-) Transcript_49498:58-984(-)|eukprot:CAMPEP_0119378746 /NCGR_PEP_ID=MMETSP1334-20130426/49672_1 /TAXON_ID=127549 /ORGANISM="Calcidiscus leptoporus, Strain RCC1130" /LENGTH=308 /DNA_ID=CAMNT_0007398045 /DNA_START=69 /DNA_END=995 /DNA_ORIENTATION=+